ncbi:uncharacterized protein CTHT_0016460 [Thermochaetoides thermophila DSM 1495]|uniref:Uncharacterized protein n=1 Tax=Chaetomium thermophilum (strain DSM 1495 / CBS 144.50 / IMI 039719) TaxID=759272 RepID=G0S297_CHATD|nr:hypothetical protein CTHT_0016460 [Thermochaetoides thermophila DSM 1495]EGS22130.1 hypothetical protein CTHT_0016460 [Thermochaetoides thermophila DSM 1495]
MSVAATTATPQIEDDLPPVVSDLDITLTKPLYPQVVVTRPHAREHHRPLAPSGARSPSVASIDDEPSTDVMSHLQFIWFVHPATTGRDQDAVSAQLKAAAAAECEGLEQQDGEGAGGVRSTATPPSTEEAEALAAVVEKDVKKRSLE